MKTLTVILICLFATVSFAQVTILTPQPNPQQNGDTYTYYNTIDPTTGNSQTGFIYQQPSSSYYPNSGIVTDLNTGNQYYYNQSGGFTNIINLQSK